jgi:hypothetical protein
MRRSNYSEFINPYEETITRLRDELFQARWVILELMPEGAQKILHSFLDCESRQERANWKDIAADGIIALAKPIQSQGPFQLVDRAYCPLCGGGSSSPYESGFTLDEGLRRHLLGWGNAHRCQIMEAAVLLARDYWHDKFHAADEAEDEQKRAQIAQRKKTETLYRIAPDREPELFDERAYGGVPRDEDSLAWAEGRLIDLSFQTALEGNVKSYTDEREAFTVYADPRMKGEIKFTVYRKSPTKGKTAPRVRTKYLHSFSLKDNWKNDIRGKYESRIAQITL